MGGRANIFFDGNMLFIFYMYGYYLIKKAHYFFQGKVTLLATHQMLTEHSVLYFFVEQSQHKKSVSLERGEAILTLAEFSFCFL